MRLFSRSKSSMQRVSKIVYNDVDLFMERGREMNVKKLISIVTGASVLAVSFGGCDLLQGKDKQAVNDLAEAYIEAVKEGDFKASKKLVEDREDYFREAVFTDEEISLISAIFDSSEYTVEGIEINKDKASAQLTFILPDVASISDEGYTFDEFIDAIEDIDDTVEEQLSFEFVKDGDSWYIDPDTTEDFYELIADTLELCEYGALNEETALEIAEQYLTLLSEGDYVTAFDMTVDVSYLPFDVYGDLGEFIYNNGEGYSDAFASLISTYFSNLEYDLQIGNVYDDSIEVLVTGTAPDGNAAVEESMNDVEIMTPIIADLYDYEFNDADLLYQVFEGLSSAVNEAVEASSRIPYSSTITVVADENDRLSVIPGYLMGDCDFTDPENLNEISLAAFGMLRDQGRITQAEYNQYISEYCGVENDGGYDVTMYVIESGDDLWSYSCDVNDEMITLHVQTTAYYDEGDSFEWEAAINGNWAVSGTYVIPSDFNDRVELQIPVVTGGAAADYEVRLYDYEADTVLADIEIVVLDEGAPANPDALPFGESMSYDFGGDDFYDFYFTDDDYERLSGDHIDVNDGKINFVVRTWGYYDDDDAITCQIYLNDEEIARIAAYADPDNTDTFYFEYAPDELEPGDYTLMISNVNEPSTMLVMAFATVE